MRGDATDTAPQLSKRQAKLAANRAFAVDPKHAVAWPPDVPPNRLGGRRATAGRLRGRLVARAPETMATGILFPARNVPTDLLVLDTREWATLVRLPNRFERRRVDKVMRTNGLLLAPGAYWKDVGKVWSHQLPWLKRVPRAGEL